MKKPFSTQVDADVQARVRATVVGVQRLDPAFTLAQFTQDALTAHCSHLEDLHNGGSSWPHDAGTPRPGVRLARSDDVYSAE